MSQEWPGEWHSKEVQSRGAGITNDRGTLYLIDDDGDGWLWMDEVPSHLENRC